MKNRFEQGSVLPIRVSKFQPSIEFTEIQELFKTREKFLTEKIQKLNPDEISLQNILSLC